jgi:RNA polymerase sigma factor for flagellar operon FliA
MKPCEEAYRQHVLLTAEDREQLVIELLPQVRYIARRIHDRLPQHVPFDDLMNAGVLGLLDAIRKYDPSKRAQLMSYAKFRIRGAILDGLRDLDWSPRDLRRQARRIEGAQARLGTLLGRNPNDDEIAAELNMSLAEYQQLLGNLRGLDLGSLQAETYSEDGHEEEIISYIPYDPEEDPFHLYVRGEMKDVLARAIGELPKQQSQVLALYYYEELTMKEVGAVLGVGEARVSQIHSAAILGLRTRMQQLLQSRRVPPQERKALKDRIHR